MAQPQDDSQNSPAAATNAPLVTAKKDKLPDIPLAKPSTLTTLSAGGNAGASSGDGSSPSQKSPSGDAQSPSSNKGQGGGSLPAGHSIDKVKGTANSELHTDL